MAFRLNPLQTLLRSADFCDALQQAVRILRRHGVKLLHPLTAIEGFDGAKVGIQPVDQLVQFLIGQSAFNLIDSISPKSKGDRFAAVQLLQPTLQILCIPDLDIIRKGWIGQNIDNAFRHREYFHRVNSLRVLDQLHNIIHGTAQRAADFDQRFHTHILVFTQLGHGVGADLGRFDELRFTHTFVDKQLP